MFLFRLEAVEVNYNRKLAEQTCRKFEDRLEVYQRGLRHTDRELRHRSLEGYIRGQLELRKTTRGL